LTESNPGSSPVATTVIDLTEFCEVVDCDDDDDSSVECVDLKTFFSALPFTTVENERLSSLPKHDVCHFAWSSSSLFICIYIFMLFIGVPSFVYPFLYLSNN